MAERVFDVGQFKRTILGERPGLSDLATLLGDYRLMVGAVIEAVVERFERRAGYGFVDTKLSLIDGRDFADDDPLRGPDVIYGWIQGRGLEALAGHCQWLFRQEHIDAAQRASLCRRLREMTAAVAESMLRLRAANGGRLFFMMDRQGRPLRVGPDGKPAPFDLPADAPANMSELFFAKGLLAAADLLGRTDWLELAHQAGQAVLAEISAGRFRSDQQSLDPRNVALAPVPGRITHAPRMIGLGAAALFVELTGQEPYLQAGLEFIDFILDHHVDTAGAGPTGRQFDMWEFADPQGKAFIDADGTLLSDPGHAAEFVGLGLRLLHCAQRRGLLGKVEPTRLARYRQMLPEVLRANFANGFSPGGLGIVKAYDLIGRKPINDDMPWWNLPETMRAALESARVAPDPAKLPLADIARQCSNAFIGNFVRPELGLMAVQTLSAAGKVVPVVPATPDADPGYHTGLSLIDCLTILEETFGQG